MGVYKFCVVKPIHQSHCVFPIVFYFYFFSVKEMSCHFNVFHLQITVLSKNDAKSSDSLVLIWGFPGRPSGKEPACQCRRHKRCGFDH